jgi:hypothetical protein
MLSGQLVAFRAVKQPAYVGFYGFAYYFYFKGHRTLERALPGSRKT